MTTTTFLPTRSLRYLRTFATRLVVMTLAVGSCQLAIADAAIYLARHINHGSSRTGNRLSACRLEPPVWELGISQGSPPRDSLEASNDAASPSHSSVPYWAVSARPLLARLHGASSVLPTTSIVTLATTLVAAVPARGPPAL